MSDLAQQLRDAARRHNGVICDTGDRATFIEAAAALEALTTAEIENFAQLGIETVRADRAEQRIKELEAEKQQAIQETAEWAGLLRRIKELEVERDQAVRNWHLEEDANSTSIIRYQRAEDRLAAAEAERDALLKVAEALREEVSHDDWLYAEAERPMRDRLRAALDALPERQKA